MTSVAVVGAGFGGVGAAARLAQAGYQDVVVFERAPGVGGVWQHNDYPGAACDIPSHLYEFSFAPNPRWSRRFAPQAEIRAYIEDVARRYGVLDRIRTSTEVQRAEWDDGRSKWLLTTSSGAHEADILITACGQLTNPSIPPIPGQDTFEGHSFHTARWRHDVDLTGLRVGVVGTGCSAIQVVPAIAPAAGHVSVFQKSAGWTLPKGDFAYSERAKRLFERLPLLQRLDRAAVFATQEVGTLAMTRWAWLRKPIQSRSLRRIGKTVADPELRRQVTPADEFGCKRVMLTDEWYPILSRPDVDLVTNRIAAVTPHGIRTDDGVEHPVDVLVWATGFESHGFVAPMEVLGTGGRKLADDWSGGAKGQRSRSIRVRPAVLY